MFSHQHWDTLLSCWCEPATPYELYTLSITYEAVGTRCRNLENATFLEMKFMDSFNRFLSPFSMLYRVEFGVKCGKCTHPYMRNVYT
jgi:hypothetical protein